MMFNHRSLSWPKLIGSLVFVGALLMVLGSAGKMFTSWDNVHAVNDCLSAAQGDASFIPTCQSQAFYAGMGLVRVQQHELTTRQAWSAVFEPVAWFFIWLAVLVWGWTAYKAGWIPRMAFSLWNEMTGTASVQQKKKK